MFPLWGFRCDEFRDGFCIFSGKVRLFFIILKLFLFRNDSKLNYVIMTGQELSLVLRNKGIKVTPQRLAVLKAIRCMRDHPVAEEVAREVRLNNPGVAMGTIYNILDLFASKGLIVRLRTPEDVMRFDANPDKHHHLHCEDTGELIDYRDEHLDAVLRDYFARQGLDGFQVRDVQVYVEGKKVVRGSKGKNR